VKDPFSPLPTSNRGNVSPMPRALHDFFFSFIEAVRDNPLLLVGLDGKNPLFLPPFLRPGKHIRNFGSPGTTVYVSPRLPTSPMFLLPPPSLSFGAIEQGVDFERLRPTELSLPFVERDLVGECRSPSFPSPHREVAFFLPHLGSV